MQPPPVLAFSRFWNKEWLKYLWGGKQALNFRLVLCIVEVPQLSWFSLNLCSQRLGRCRWKYTYQTRCLFGKGKKLSRSINGCSAVCVLKDRIKEHSRHLSSRMSSSVIFPVLGNYVSLLWAYFKPTECFGSAFRITFLKQESQKASCWAQLDVIYIPLKSDVCL